MIRGSIVSSRIFSLVLFAIYFPCTDCQFGSLYSAPTQFVETYNYPSNTYSNPNTPYYPVEYAQGYAPLPQAFPTYAQQSSLAAVAIPQTGIHPKRKPRGRKNKRKILSHSNDAHAAQTVDSKISKRFFFVSGDLGCFGNDY